MKRLIPIFLAAALLLTGCHNGKSDSSESSTTATTSVTTIATTTNTETAERSGISTDKPATEQATKVTATSVAKQSEPNKNDRSTELKEEYTTPEIEVTEFDDEDVITTSDGAKVNEDGSIDLPIVPIR